MSVERDPKLRIDTRGWHATHQVVFGESGLRSGCRVCRACRYTHDFKERAEWREPCQPSEDALAKYRAEAQRRIDDGQAMLAHADTFKDTPQ